MKATDRPVKLDSEAYRKAILEARRRFRRAIVLQLRDQSPGRRSRNHLPGHTV